jgi:hypothetical protein
MTQISADIDSICVDLRDLWATLFPPFIPAPQAAGLSA